jgi:hypothetical protein
MKLAAVLLRLARAGVGITVIGDRLRVRPPRDGLSDELRELIVAHKPALLEALDDERLKAAIAAPHTVSFWPTLRVAIAAVIEARREFSARDRERLAAARLTRGGHGATASWIVEAFAVEDVLWGHSDCSRRL